MFSREQAQEIFPFCLILDRAGRVAAVGRSIASHRQALVGKPIAEVAQLRRAQLEQLDGDLSSLVGRTVSLNLSCLGFALTGSFYECDGGHVFLGAPRPRDTEELRLSGLTIAALAPHDALVSYIFAMQDLEGARDRAERLSAENTRRREEVERIVDSSSDLIFRFDETGSIDIMNPAARRALGCGPEELNAYDLLAIESATELETLCATSKDVGRTFEVRTPASHSLLLAGRVVQVTGQANPGYVAFLSDVTEERRVAEELEQARQRIERGQRMEALGRLAGSISHDFSNILGVILGSADLILESLPPDHPLAEDVELMRESAEMGAGIARQLLALGDGEPDSRSNTDLLGLTRRLEPILRLIASSARLTLEVQEGEGWVGIPSASAEQILMNLVLNASEAIGEDGTIRVQARVDSATQRVCLAVEDDGCGIPPDVIDHIFEPYYSTRSAEGGSGIGLSTVFTLANRAEGSVDVESAVGRGTTLRIELPVTEASEASVDEPPSRKSTFAPELLAVVVDDNPGIERIVSRQMNKMGFEVVSHNSYASAQDGWSSLERAADILVTDVSLGDGSGLELAESAFENGHCRDVLLITGHADMEDVSRLVQVHQWKVLLKPFGGKELRAVIESRLASLD